MKGRKAVPTVLGLAAIAMLAGSPAVPADAVAEARDWVGKLPRDRVYTDGYLLLDEPSLLTMRGQLGMIPMPYLPFLLSAWSEFLELPGLTGEQRDPRHYKAGFELRDAILTVTVQGLLLPRLRDGQPDGVLRVSIGPSALFRYDFNSGELLEQKLLR